MNPPKNVSKNIDVGNTNVNGSSVNIAIYIVIAIATTIPTTVPINPDAIISASAS
jgi:hypothetical protein